MAPATALAISRGLIAPDVNAPPGQPRRQASILPFFADGERELRVRHRHIGGLVLFAQLDAVDTRRAEGTCYHRGGLVVPLHNVNLLAARSR